MVRTHPAGPFAASSPNTPQSPAASSCHFHSSAWASASVSSGSGSTTSRWLTRGQGHSRQRQNRGAVGHVTRAMVVTAPSCRTTTRRRSSAVNGCSQLAQSPAPLSSAHGRFPPALWACCNRAVTRACRRAASTGPSVATEMVCRPRSTVTASSALSSASTSATERVTHRPPNAPSGVVGSAAGRAGCKHFLSSGMNGVPRPRKLNEKQHIVGLRRTAENPLHCPPGSAACQLAPAAVGPSLVRVAHFSPGRGTCPGRPR